MAIQTALDPVEDLIEKPGASCRAAASATCPPR